MAVAITRTELDAAGLRAAARSAGMDRQTLRDRVHRDNERGLAGLKNLPNTGAPPRKLTKAQETTMAAWVRHGPTPERHKVVRWRLIDLRDEIARAFGEQTYERTVGKLMVRLNFAHLAEISSQMTPGAHAVLTLDGAGWHQRGGKLRVPDNISLLPLPPYSPEPNPVENIWQFLRQNYLAHRVFDTCDAIVDACCTAWNRLVADPPRITSITTRSSAQTVSA